MDNILNFFLDNFPTNEIIVKFTIPFFIWVTLTLFVCGYLKKKRNWRTGLTRKTFHLVIFITSAAIQSKWGMQVLCYFGAWTSLVVFYAVIRGKGNSMYEALARENDEPNRTHFVVVPWLATFLGGVICNIYFAKYALIGYLIVGLADAIAEPVGVLWGKHRYRALSYGMNNRTTFRSLEGSASIVMMCIPIFIFGLSGLGLALNAQLIFLAILLSLLISLVEAVSPHGWDNFSLQLATAGLIHWFFN